MSFYVYPVSFREHRLLSMEVGGHENAQPQSSPENEADDIESNFEESLQDLEENVSDAPDIIDSVIESAQEMSDSSTRDQFKELMDKYPDLQEISVTINGETIVLSREQIEGDTNEDASETSENPDGENDLFGNPEAKEKAEMLQKAVAKIRDNLRIINDNIPGTENDYDVTDVVIQGDQILLKCDDPADIQKLVAFANERNLNPQTTDGGLLVTVTRIDEKTGLWGDEIKEELEPDPVDPYGPGEEPDDGGLDDDGDGDLDNGLDRNEQLAEKMSKLERRLSRLMDNKGLDNAEAKIAKVLRKMENIRRKTDGEVQPGNKEYTDGVTGVDYALKWIPGPGGIDRYVLLPVEPEEEEPGPEEEEPGPEEEQPQPEEEPEEEEPEEEEPEEEEPEEEEPEEEEPEEEEPEEEEPEEEEPEEEEPKPLDVERLKIDYVAKLKEYREMPKEDFMAMLTPEFISKHEKNGTLFLVLLAIDGHDSTRSMSDAEAKSAVEQFVEDGAKLKGLIDKAQTLPIAEVKENLSNYKNFFKQENLPAVDIDNLITNLDEAQLRGLYEFCITEDFVRNQNITYGGDAFRDVLNANNRVGDCNEVAQYYASLISFVRPSNLDNRVRYLNANGHAQVMLDLGTGTDGKPVHISKNTSYVDMSGLNNGRQKDSHPYEHNFYNASRDLSRYGIVNNDRAFSSPSELVAGELGEIDGQDEYISDLTDDQLQANIDRYETLLSLNTHNPTALSNWFKNRFEQISRQKKAGETPSDADRKEAGEYLARFSETSFESVWQLSNFRRLFGKEAAKTYVKQYESNMLNASGTGASDAFKDFISQPVQAMRDLPSFDRRKVTSDNTISIDIENRMSLLNILYGLTENPVVEKECERMYNELKKEKESWLPKS